MTAERTLRIGITCYPSVGGSGIVASTLGEELARRGHEIHFISYEKPFRMPADLTRVSFHPVVINDYELFKYPDYTLPLSVKMAEVARDHALDILHVHYAVPHATAAILARSMLPPAQQPKVVTTLHGTDTTLLGRDPGYGPAIRHALAESDAVTTVSEFLRNETIRTFDVRHDIEVVPNFFQPREPTRSAGEVRAELGLRDELVIVHASNLRPMKRIDVLLETVARVRSTRDFKLLVLAGAAFEPHRALVRQLGIENRVLVRERVLDIEDYLQIGDLGLFTSDSESFCVSILEAMCFGCPSVSTRVGGVPEVVQDGVSGVLCPAGDTAALALAVSRLLDDVDARTKLGQAARQRAEESFRPSSIVPCYEAIYRRLLAA